MYYILSFSIPLILGLILFKPLSRLLEKSEFTELNFRGKEIPIGMGIHLILVFIITILGIGRLIDMKDSSYLLSTGIAFMGFLGIIDDFLGDKHSKGFKGHIKSLLKGELTTGGLKAIGGFGIAFLLSINMKNTDIGEIILNTFLIALFANIINLFDLRPGRASKAFIFFLLIFAIMLKDNSYYNYILIFLGGIIAYINKDLKALVMLGDTGANAMGISLGILAAISLNIEIKIGLLLFLIILNLVSEFVSFTKIIERVKIFKFIDELGRK
ncbi:MAG: phospho-N-acetylmuramoyl-pentapeptide-transferase [Andreesenia angusta]|nr:phospho-N-acetylmuramoyl-pentapeptide-transferase [Andreesenia angusta]